VHPGVYVPRPHTEALVRRAVRQLPTAGVAVDVCTGSGAIAMVMGAARPAARVVGCDIDAAAVACARANGVEAYCGDLFEPLPHDLRRTADVVVGVVPYVPTPALRFLQRDTFTFERTGAYDGGPDGLDVLRRVAVAARDILRPDGTLLLELGGDQADQFADELDRLGYIDIEVLVDDEGDARGIGAARGDEQTP
jgi:release factor glutamine methyltransferase